MDAAKAAADPTLNAMAQYDSGAAWNLAKQRALAAGTSPAKVQAAFPKGSPVASPRGSARKAAAAAAPAPPPPPPAGGKKRAAIAPPPPPANALTSPHHTRSGQVFNAVNAMANAPAGSPADNVLRQAIARRRISVHSNDDDNDDDFLGSFNM